MPQLAKIPPPAAFVASLGVSLLLTHWAPILQVGWFRAPRAALIVAGTALVWMAWAGVEFRKHRTSVLPNHEPTHLLSRGPFRFSRNPLYGGMLVIACTPWLAVGELGLLIGPLSFFAFAHWVVIPSEEETLHRSFGAAYDDYCRTVRRWL